jgi:hypothetical protein
MNQDRGRAFVIVLLAVHGFLALWAIVGFAEWFAPETPWPRVSNELFPGTILFMQWALTLGAAIVFIGGMARRWPYTPAAMTGIYGAMATLCAVQTFEYMQGELRFVAMGLEYVAYAGILGFLFRSNRFERQIPRSELR